MNDEIITLDSPRKCKLCCNEIPKGAQAIRYARYTKKGRLWHQHKHVDGCPEQGQQAPGCMGRTGYAPGGGRVLRHPATFS